MLDVGRRKHKWRAGGSQGDQTSSGASKGGGVFTAT